MRYRLRTRARVRFTVQRVLTGRRPGAIRRLALRGSFTHVSGVGATRLRFTGRLARRRLPIGSYRLVASVLDAAGQATSSQAVRFRIVDR